MKMGFFIVMEGRMFVRGNICLAVLRPGRQGWLRFRPYCRPLILALCLLAFFRPAFSAPFCATPGNDGPASPSGIINTYYPGTSSASAGATSISVGPPSAGTPIAAGDLLLVIQMQDADINTSNDIGYGGSSSGSGYTSLNQAGLYEYVIAKSFSGSSVNITSGLVNSYRSRLASGTNGQSTFQVIRVPQYSTASVLGTGTASVSALPWNGTVGGVVAMDVAGTLTISGNVTASGAGFRGGWGESSNTTGPYTDYRTRATILGNGMKGEGIAGTPNRMNQPSGFDGAPNLVTSGSLGYPDGANNDASKGRGAPGNAGGGGTDGDTANSQNSGGGGGGNYAAGAKGGNSWNSNRDVGGEGGSAVTGLAASRVVMGGGGGAGTTNNGTGDFRTYPSPAGLACTAGAGACSSGAPGGGIILLRANSISGGGTVTANGGSGYNTLQDSAGGGGAGGAVVINTQAGGSVNVFVNGGNGGNAWRFQAPDGYPGERHGPGGGGSGGFIAFSPSGLGIAMHYAAGLSGMTTTANDNYGSLSSSGGYSTFNSPNPPGPLPGAACLPDLSTSTKTVVDTSSGDYKAGDILQYTITLIETNGVAASGVSVTDNIPANVTGFTVPFDGIPAGATDNSDGTGYGANGTGYLNITGINVPANGSVTIVFTVTIPATATPGSTITNTATVTPPLGKGASPVAPVVTVYGSAPGTGNKPLYLSDNGSTPPSNDKLSRTRMAGNAGYSTIATATPKTWAMNPVAAADITISPPPSPNNYVPVTLYMRRNTSGTTRNIKVDLQCSSGGTVLTQTRTFTNMGTTITAYTFNLTTASPPWTTPITCTKGNTWNLTVSEPADIYATRVYANNGAANPSHVDLPATTVINVKSIKFYDAGGNAITPVTTGSQVYFQAEVSDPFGSYDINPAIGGTAPTITVRDPANNSNTYNMSLLSTDTETPSLTKTFQYGPITPAIAGNWSISVTATEGTEGTVRNTGYATMPVVIPTPNLTVLKSAFGLASGARAIPGQEIPYMVTVANTGTGVAGNVVVIDCLSPYSAWTLNSLTFADGVAPSGPSGLSLANSTMSYSYDNGSTWSSTAPADDGTGHAPAVNCWKLVMDPTKSMNANPASFTLNYRAKVK
jgi:uncharacterized repeat protein (TIGR01451 family)